MILIVGMGAHDIIYHPYLNRVCAFSCPVVLAF